MHRMTSCAGRPGGWRAGAWVTVLLAVAGCASTPPATGPAGAQDGAKGPSAAAASPSAATAAGSTAADPGSEIDNVKPDAGNLRAFVELARADIRLNKAVIVAQNLPLTESEAAEFWPVYREYELDLSKLMDRKIEGIRKYFAKAGELNDEQAKALADEALDIESERTALKRTYFKKFQDAVPATKVARFFQIDNQLNMLVDLRIAAALPLIK